MLNGDERRIVLIRDIKSPYFDEAYFVMKDNCNHLIQSDVLSEAEKILGKARIPKKKRCKPGKLIYSFSCGALCGAIAAFLITLFI